MLAQNGHELPFRNLSYGKFFMKICGLYPLDLK